MTSVGANLAPRLLPAGTASVRYEAAAVIAPLMLPGCFFGAEERAGDIVDMPLARLVDSRVAEGRCATASEVVRAALRPLMEGDDARKGPAEATRMESLTHG